MYYGELDEDDEQSISVSVANEVKSESETTIYLSTTQTDLSTTISPVRSLMYPPSWPSSADLAKDSDVYPIDPPSRHRRSREDINSEISVYLDLAEKPQTPEAIEEQEQSGITSRYSQSSTSKRECSEVCGDICVCAQEEDTVGKSSTETLDSSMKYSMPEFDIPFIKDIIELPMDRRTIAKLCFGETLIVSHNRVSEPKEEVHFAPNVVAGSVYPQMIEMHDIDEIGGMCISIQKSEHNLITYCTSQFSFENNGANSTLLSVVDRKLNLIEEKKTETLLKDSGKTEKSLHVFQEMDHHIAFRTSVEDLTSSRHRGIIKMNVTGNLLLDGAGFILMRYLILKKFSGDLEVWSMHVTGEVCRCVYSAGKRKLLMIRNRPYETIRIVKILFRMNRKPDISKTYFLPTGHIVRHRWLGCPYFMHLNPMGKIPPCNYFASLEQNWENDIQLMSTYLDFKQQRQSEIKSYLDDNGEVKCMIKDYMMCLLQNKPKYVLDFTNEYFQNLLIED